jgi:hypothetical protein
MLLDVCIYCRALCFNRQKEFDWTEWGVLDSRKLATYGVVYIERTVYPACLHLSRISLTSFIKYSSSYRRKKH